MIVDHGKIFDKAFEDGFLHCIKNTDIRFGHREVIVDDVRFLVKLVDTDNGFEIQFLHNNKLIKHGTEIISCSKYTQDDIIIEHGD